MLEEACGKVAVKKTQVYEWLKCFFNGCESVDYTRCGRPSTFTNDENIENVRFVVQSVMKEYAGDINRCRNISWKHSQ
jgi:hypothetical protein